VTGPPPIPAVEASPAAASETILLHRLPGADLGRLTMGFYFWFWGGLLVVIALCESFTAFSMRLLDTSALAAGCLGLFFGARRLHQVQTLGDAWRRRTREALIAAGLLAYLYPFFLMWRRLPANMYLLGHALGFFAILCFSLTLACQITAVIGRADGRRALVTQSILFGTLAVVVLFPLFALFAQVMILAAREGRDPLSLLQFWLGRTQPWLVFAPLLPFALTLALVWTAKDLALQRLLAMRENESGNA
jgi:hypothetical protein